MEFKIKNLDYDFRIKKMSVIEVLAIRANLSYDSIDESTKLFNDLLERVEFKFNDTWIPVKHKNLPNLSPACLEEDIVAVKEIIDFFITEYLRKVFMKSNESKK